MFCFLLVTVVGVSTAANLVTAAENIAPKAKVTAGSEYSSGFLAKSARWTVSRLTEILRNGHCLAAVPGTAQKWFNVPQSEREKIYLWIDLNVPYYPTSASNHREQIGCRRMYPDNLDEAGGTGKCGKVVFETKDDPDYRRIVDTFQPVQDLVRRLPRADMPEFVEPNCQVDQITVK